MKNFEIEISVYDNQTLVVKKNFDQDKIVVGRILSADFRIPNPKISRIHALIERSSDGRLKVTDLASTHGTFINGERIIESFCEAQDKVELAGLRVQLRKIDLSPEKMATMETSVTAAPIAGQDAVQGSELGAREVAPAVVDRSQVDPTVIRSLKETARTRGVLDPTTLPHEELEMTVYWEETILAIDHYKKQHTRISIGEDLSVDYVVPSTAFPKAFDLVDLKSDKAVVNLHPSMKLSARIQGKMFTMDELTRSGQNKIELNGSDIAKIQIGSVNFFLMFVPEPQKLPKAAIFDQGKLYWGILALTSLALVMFLSFGHLFTNPIDGTVKEFPERVRKILLKNFKFKKEVQKKIKEVVEKKSDGDKKTESDSQKSNTQVKVKSKGGNDREGAKEKGTEGKRGKTTAKKSKGVTNRPKKKNKVSKVNKAPNSKVKKKTLLEKLRNSKLGSRLKSGAVAGGNDSLKKALEGTGGATKSSSRGSGGSGITGTGRAGGGKVAGVGGLGTKGVGGGAAGKGNSSLPGKGTALVSGESGGVAVGSGLSREEIERVIRRHMNEVKDCYQLQLQKDPSLSGKVTMKWKIVRGGKVTALSTAQNTTGNRSVSRCIAQRMRSWKFPSPPGEAVAVTYPFILKPGR